MTSDDTYLLYTDETICIVAQKRRELCAVIYLFIYSFICGSL